MIKTTTPSLGDPRSSLFSFTSGKKKEAEDYLESLRCNPTAQEAVDICITAPTAIATG